MSKSFWIVFLAGISLSSAHAQIHSVVFAPGANRVSTFLHTALVQRSRVLVDAADEMPADKYGYRAPPDNVTFGYLTLHIADGNYLFCSYIGGVPMPQLPKLSETDAKPALIARIKASFDFCTTALANLDDSRMSDMLTMGDTKMSRSMAVLTLTGSWTTHLDQQQKYLELNGLPVSAAK
jgi:hypothetical protein